MAKKKRVTKKKQAKSPVPVSNNDMGFKCVTCGWSKMLRFDDDEIDLLHGNIRSYSGPCPECGSMTLVPTTSWTAMAPYREKHLEQIRNMERDMLSLGAQLRSGGEEIASLRKQVADAQSTNKTVCDERDTYRRENGRLRRITKALREAFVAATEEDAPPALPFGRLGL
jgi:predicted RNA-binding Zn-ribbon protein involved in translation (DUF1610 family)